MSAIGGKKDCIGGKKHPQYPILEVVNVSDDLRKVESAYIYYFQSYKNEVGYNSVIGAGVDTTKLKGDK